MSKFGERLRMILEKKELQGKEFAKILNVEPPTVSNWLNGNRFPKDDILIKIADFFDISLDYLLGRTDNPNAIISEADIDGHHYEFESDRKVFSNGLTYEQMVEKLKVLDQLEKLGFKYNPEDKK